LLFPRVFSSELRKQHHPGVYM